MSAYLDRLFESYKSASPTLTEGLTMDEWLDGPRSWRKVLCEIGQRAKMISNIADSTVARREWGIFAYANSTYRRDYITSIPLLERTASRADYDDEVFQQWMTDLATLADI